MSFEFLDQFEGRDDPMIDRAGDDWEEKKVEEEEEGDRQDTPPLETN